MSDKQDYTKQMQEFNIEDMLVKENLTFSCPFGDIRVSNDSNDFLISDFRADNPRIPVIEIMDIYVKPEYRRSGVGTKLLEQVAYRYQDHAILVAAGASMREYPEEPSDEVVQDELIKLDDFYKKSGFIDVNEFYGGYEGKRAYMYLNDIGRTIADKLSQKEITECVKEYIEDKNGRFEENEIKIGKTETE